jgi:TonB family protein
MVIPRHKPALKGTPWLSMALVFVVFSGLTFAFMALKSAGSGDSKLGQVMKVLFPGSDLELRAASHGDSLWITWNRRNPAVAASTGAVLAVSDGPRHFERKLDPSQVVDGEVRYAPVSGDVTFELRVYGADQSMAVGSLRVVDATLPVVSDTKPPLDLVNPATSESSAANNSVPAPASSSQSASPEPTELSKPAVEAPNKLNIPVLNMPLTVPVSKPAAAKHAPETSKPARQIAQHPAQQSPTQQQKPAQSIAVEPSPPVATQALASTPKPATPHSAAPSGNSTAPASSGTAITGWDPNLLENRPATAPATQQAPPQTAPPDSKTVDFIGPRVLLQVMPSTRNFTPGLIAEATRVEVEVSIDTSGHVKAAHLTNPHVKSLLGSAAVAAAKQWTFQPATLRGQHVDSDHTIVFEFRPEGQ